MTSMEERLSTIEERLSKLEHGSQVHTVATVTPSPATAQKAKISAPPAPVAKPEGPPLATKLLGWGGAGSLVLAASYFVKLAWEAGWLTPERQIGLSIVAALIMVAVGLMLKSRDREYAGLLPAGGVAILFLSTYAAHLYYGLISAQMALAAVTLTCLLSLWLCRQFESTLYALFAVAGTYSVPLLLPSLLIYVSDLAVYFSCWSVVFCLFSIYAGSRAVYLLALYLALIGFDAAWRGGSYADQWLAALSFQTMQLVIFSVATMVYTLRQREPLSESLAVLHLPALLIFYFLQYSLLQNHLPAMAPWVAVGSAAVLAACYLLARRINGDALPGGRMLLSAYLALVFFHAGYLESVPDQWAPWVAFILLPLIAGFSAWQRESGGAGNFMWAGIILIYLVNYLRMLTGFENSAVPLVNLLSVLYALEMYAGYVLVKRTSGFTGLYAPLLSAGHIAAMCAIVRILDDRLSVSLGWGGLAILCLMLALRRRDKLLGKSSLLIFAISGGKVLFYDLGASSSMLRIGSLVVVGVSFYVGGWLYRKISAM